ncbi:hypothetical protein BV25DRAFT_8188 [Artomyces pyxidatus]|uniref:Uncharacterized protein n=1 Tax=Artomyces pyxidatus TaxID=48021 RepID=A0ACB8TJD1_9AGAM|nr:hypothetical protein BV25DRAFT_8188 [Artomyces pyxidatus]
MHADAHFSDITLYGHRRQPTVREPWGGAENGLKNGQGKVEERCRLLLDAPACRAAQSARERSCAGLHLATWPPPSSCQCAIIMPRLRGHSGVNAPSS